MEFIFQNELTIPVAGAAVKGELTIPTGAKAIIVFSHGSGSSRFSKRNQFVARLLQKRKFGTLLFDLLTEEEDKYYYSRFNINLLSKRLIDATKWLQRFPYAKGYAVGYFGASTGAASALKAAAVINEIGAVVSRGGRPDMAMDVIAEVTAPTILIVGSRDEEVLELNKQAYRKMKCLKKLEVIEGATHLFEEPGKLEIVANVAADWFEKYLLEVSVNS